MVMPWDTAAAPRLMVQNTAARRTTRRTLHINRTCTRLAFQDLSLLGDYPEAAGTSRKLVGEKTIRRAACFEMRVPAAAHRPVGRCRLVRQDECSPEQPEGRGGPPVLSHVFRREALVEAVDPETACFDKSIAPTQEGG